MLHSGWMDITQGTDARTALVCARLHLRHAKRHLHKGLSAAGMIALYDSILFGMRHYIARHSGCASFVKNTDLWDAISLFHALARAGVFDDPLVFNRLSLATERALWQESFSFDADATLAEVEAMLTKLGVMPFHESVLPNESLTAH
jgi:hypothetical protein